MINNFLKKRGLGMEKRFISVFMALQVICFLMLGALKAQTLDNFLYSGAKLTAQMIKDHLTAYEEKNPGKKLANYVNDKDVSPSVFCFVARRFHDLDVLRFLIECGYVITNKDYKSLFEDRYSPDMTPILKFVIEHVDVSFINCSTRKMNILGCLCEDGRLDLITAIFDRVKDNKALKEKFLETGDSVSSLLYIASNSNDKSQDRIKLIDYLINQGADLNQRGGGDKETPLMAAYKKPNMTIVNFLLEKGADINAQDSSGQTLLKQAYAKNDSAAITNFINKGADVNIHLDSSKTTPLMRACENNDVEQVKLLIEKGANVMARNVHKYTALNRVILLSCRYKNNNSEFNTKKEIIDFLIEKGADVNDEKRPPLISCVDNCNQGLEGHVSAVIDLLINSGADVNITDKEGNTPLLIACRVDFSGFIVQKLIQRGADVTHTNNLKRNCIHLAVINKNYTLIPILVNAGAGVNEFDRYNNTPLHWIVDTTTLTSLHFNCIIALVESGANCSIPDRYGRLPAQRMLDRYISQDFVLRFDNTQLMNFDEFIKVLELVLSAYPGVIKEKNLEMTIFSSEIPPEEKTKFLALFKSITSKNIASDQATGGGSKQPETSSPITQQLKTLQQKLSELQSQLKNLAQKLTGLKARLTP